MNAPIETKMQRPPMRECQEIRQFIGEALREPIRWSEHPAWSIIAERLGDQAPKPPPAFTPAEIRALIAGDTGGAHTCPKCGHVFLEPR